MADEDTKKLIRSVKDIVELVKKRVDTIQMFQSTASDNIRMMKEQQSLMNEKLEEIQETQERHTGALIDIESRLEGFADAWKINRAEINKVKRHIGLPALSE